MDEDYETVTLGVRTDVARFARDVAEMRAQLEGPLASGAEKASRAIEAGLLRAARTGKLGFEDLGKVAMSVMSQIAASAVRDGLGALGLGGRSGGGRLGGGLLNLGTTLLARGPGPAGARDGRAGGAGRGLSGR